MKSGLLVPMSSSGSSVPSQSTRTWQLTVAAHATPAASTSAAPRSVIATMILFIAQPHFFGTPHWSTLATTVAKPEGLHFPQMGYFREDFC
jgi:hypothetical protein